MAKYTKIASLADAELFDGSKTNADALVVSYPSIISVAKVESVYPVYTGANSLTAGATGVTGSFVTDEAGSATVAGKVTMTISHACTTSGDLTISILGKTLVVPCLDTMDSATKVATAIRATKFTGWVLAGSNAIVTFTVAQPKDSVLNVTNHLGKVMNCYATNYIVFNTDMKVAGITTSTTEIWDGVNFAKYYTAVPS